ncbi:orotidine-5'-phosphate decarboxylase [Synechococcus sp. MEDNS5]|uniref:orotidine-5'-phosphate decarboxylase n=1 Tax=Synechococcus sp. MEDNS5 TaxID=1442554 RepID=UPI00351C256B
METAAAAVLASLRSALPADRIIVALDGMAPDQALAFSAQVEGLRWVKVGLELFLQAGPEVVAQLREQGLRVFLDLKFHDIPVTMAGACRRAAALGAELITVHACAGNEALQAAQTAAVEGAQSSGQRVPTLLAVTVLTSWEEQRLQRELAIAQAIAERVPALAQLSATAGIGGCVCSPLEAAALRAQHPEPFALVTPGIRPKGAAVGDQARVMGPAEAISAGASQLVIGRPITKAEDPSDAFAACCAELRTGS